VIASIHDAIAAEPDQKLSTNPIETTSPRAVVSTSATVGTRISSTALRLNRPLVMVMIQRWTAATVSGPNQPPT
jgi:hypothetical protein